MMYPTIDIGGTIAYFLDEGGMDNGDRLQYTLDDGRVVRFRLEQTFPSKAAYESWRKAEFGEDGREEVREEVIKRLREKGMMKEDE